MVVEEKQGLIPTMVQPCQGTHQDCLSWGLCEKPAEPLKWEAITGWDESKACLLGRRSYATGQSTWGLTLWGTLWTGEQLSSYPVGGLWTAQMQGPPPEGC